MHHSNRNNEGKFHVCIAPIYGLLIRNCLSIKKCLSSYYTLSLPLPGSDMSLLYPVNSLKTYIKWVVHFAL